MTARQRLNSQTSIHSLSIFQSEEPTRTRKGKRPRPHSPQLRATFLALQATRCPQNRQGRAQIPATHPRLPNSAFGNAGPQSGTLNRFQQTLSLKFEILRCRKYEQTLGEFEQITKSIFKQRNNDNAHITRDFGRINEIR